MFADASFPVSKDEVRILLDAAIGAAAGHGFEGQDPFRERRRKASWNASTTRLSHDALRLLIRTFAHTHNHYTLNQFTIPSTLAVEVVAFGRGHFSSFFIL
jgi:hypothetical protein